MEDLLEENPSLNSYLDEAMSKAVKLGAKGAALEMDREETAVLPTAQRLTFHEVMNARLEDETL